MRQQKCIRCGASSPQSPCPYSDVSCNGRMEQVVPATDRGNLNGSAGVAATASAGPYTPDEFRAFIGSVWNFAPDPDSEDLTRFDELLHAALVFLGQLALGHWRALTPQELAAELLRSMEQRALWGPDHPVRQP